ncbi:DeoR/GlpR family DNA-binding transcription regulator [Pseudolysinimonas sp.]|uniref:DeoR/GlpR family DNA-binding transcription regulator n=1 Tax=Pseudolysinimonas sp. TaxID=2680009 RepID=UPI003F7F2F11
MDELELPAARRERLAALVAADGFVRVADAALRLGVSEVTVRGDLRRLEADGRLRRVHGGAMAPRGERREARVEATARRDAATKRAIGESAAALVPDGASILLDVGSTCLAVAEALVARDDLAELVVVTNGLGIALALERAIPRFTVVVTGGTLRPLQHSLVDPIASRTLAELHVDLAIIGCNGVADDGTVTNLNLPEAEVKAAMLAAAGSAILVADGSKAGQRHLGRIGALGDFATLVTDAAGAERLTRAAAGTGCGVLAAG